MPSTLFINMHHKIERIKTSLQLKEEIDLHILGWSVQRVGWGLMILVLLSAGVGLFGNGLLGDKRISAHGVSLFYEKFARYENKTRIEIEAGSSDGSLTLTFQPAFAANFKVEQINPQPTTQSVQDGSTVYRFAASGRAHVTMYVSPRTWGRVVYALRVNDTEFRLYHFIYP